jgi:2-C-methyl-D-erythritol 4-phosphate cytidylyltransferase
MLVAAVLLAAGNGERLGRGPKALVPLTGRPLLSWALDALAGNDSVRQVVVVAHPHVRQPVERLVAGSAFGGRSVVVDGANSRARSVMTGLADTDTGYEFVAVAEAARPLAPPGLVDRLVGILLASGTAAAGIVPAIAVHDTVRRVDTDGRSLETVDRATLRLVQTPQVFRRDALVAAYAQVPEEPGLTDDAAFVERLGRPVLVASGDPRNFKITTAHDLAVAEAIRNAAGG